MLKSLLLVPALLLGACAHVAPAPKPAAQPIALPAPATPCLMTPPPEIRKHPLVFMAKPEELEVVTSEGEKLPVVSAQLLKPSVLDFFLNVKELDEWAASAWKSCGK